MIWNKPIPYIGEFTKIPINLFFMVGFCVHRWKPNEKRRHLQIFFILVFIFNFPFDMLSMLCYLLSKSLDTSLEKTAYIIYTTFALNALMKLCCCLFKNKKLCLALQSLQKFYPKTMQECMDYKLDENLKRIQNYNSLLMVYHLVVTSMFNLFPLLQTIVLYYQSDKQDFLFLLPFPMVYLFDYRKPLGYAVAYTTQCMGSYLASCIFLGSDLLLITCVHMINMNFRYLAKSISEYKPKGTIKDLEKLKSFIDYHTHILDTVDLIDDTFNISILLNYVGTAIITCLIGFQLVAGTSFLDLVKFLAFLISVLTHVYFISIFGTEMMTLSSDISDAFMHHSWYDGHIEYQRGIILPIARSQRSAHLNAFKFFFISMDTFKSLVSISYQFFTLIRTRYGEN